MLDPGHPDYPPAQWRDEAALPKRLTKALALALESSNRSIVRFFCMASMPRPVLGLSQST
jgi:hypothetical protein